ncbi:hypothetical protein [Phaeovulum sp.]|uniref:hypothetical protein n=1 Tax=Phaeovulum sp. TaxID=2934796 RepID=UPI0027304226|nr:hypothetical protein [Phaeovulum sp.]MDP1669867.1 hypothetical protein [Phaeovulum sp.]MDZ4118579.1 hypothetical protein [Phaeovulum sp.]
MPKLVRLYLFNIAIGFALSAVFVGLLLWLNVANLWHLVSSSPLGWVAVAMLLVFNALVFSGVQFAIAVMRMADPEGGNGGTRAPVAARRPVKVAAAARK